MRASTARAMRGGGPSPLLMGPDYDQAVTRLVGSRLTLVPLALGPPATYQSRRASAAAAPRTQSYHTV